MRTNPLAYVNLPLKIRFSVTLSVLNGCKLYYSFKYSQFLPKRSKIMIIFGTFILWSKLYSTKFNNLSFYGCQIDIGMSTHKYSMDITCSANLQEMLVNQRR